MSPDCANSITLATHELSLDLSTQSVHLMEGNNSIARSDGSSYDVQLRNFEGGLITFLQQHNLPSEKIFVEVPERINVFRNLEGVLQQIGDKDKQESLYLSKFIAGVASGLFDAALNYLWDETILQIRKRVIQYDLDFFFDNAVTGERRKKLKDESDLVKVDDYDLIKGAKEIGLISELGFKHLEYINYMRNWASAAHPNLNEITGLQVVSWLETCVKEVIALPISNVTVQIKQLLSNVKTTAVSATDAQEIAVFFTNLTEEQIDNLASGFFGIYTKQSTESQTLQNINRLLPSLWGHVSESVKGGFGLKYASFVANNLQYEKKQARAFLQLVSGEGYIPDDLRSFEIDSAIDNLLIAHRGFNNFYNEPSFASQLHRLIGNPPKVPKPLNKKYVLSLVDVFISNGNGVASGANSTYESLLSQLDSHQANIAVLSFNDAHISNKLSLAICQRKFKEMLKIVAPIVTSPPVKEVISSVESYKFRLDGLRSDKTIKPKIESLKVLLR